MPGSRKIWGWFVVVVGLLWLLGGIAGVMQAHLSAWLYVLCGAALTRLGYNLTRPEDTK